jgi:hypothetical protein
MLKLSVHHVARAGLTLGLVVLAQCSRAPAEEAQASPSTGSASSPPSPSSATPPSIAPSPSPAAEPGPPLQWNDPSRWVRRKASSPMRVAEYGVPHVTGDPTDAECTVITFGAGQGGSLEDNIGRWVRQFNPLSGPPTKATGQVNGMTVTRVEVAGSYHPMQMPGAPPAPSTQQGSRLVGAIVDAPSGFWFFKLTGPDATVKAAAPELDAMIASLHAR